MAANVSEIKRRADPRVVAILEEALADAKAGDLHGVILSGEFVGGQILTKYAGISDRILMIGHLSHQASHLHRSITEGEAS